MSLVLDASMAVCWVVPDEANPAANTILAQVLDQGAVVPCHWRLEVASVLRAAVRRRRCDQAHVDNSLARLTRLPIFVDDQTSHRAWSDTMALAVSEDLTPYDAAYLELALRMADPLATLDNALIRAARRRGAEVFSA